MVQAFSQLRRLLGQRRMTVPELHRRIQQRGVSVNLKSLYRLSRDDQPVERLDLRVAGVICQVCAVPLSELIAFETRKAQLRRLSAAKQKRLDFLMGKNNEGRLTNAERGELEALVAEAEDITLTNARVLASQRRQWKKAR
jgi:hypothetical protein